LFAFQGVLGWYMVSSGLEDVPHVSHFRLTIHLLMAMFLLALTLWMALKHRNHFPQRLPGVYKKSPFILSLLMTAVIVVQISYGGFVAGLKAGWLSNSWPLMFGRLIPLGMLSELTPWWLNLLEADVTVHFIHRWLAFAVLAMAGVVVWQTRKRPSSPAIKKATLVLLALICAQILLGISVVLFGVPTVLALSHQALAMVLFVIAVFINFQVVYNPEAEVLLTVTDLSATAVGD
jgi:cytochrome c oxidase assembly protein subunit 15